MIEHKGTVVSVTDEHILVEVINQSACAGCKAKSFCSLSGQSEKIISIPNQPDTVWHTGEEVMVEIKESLGFKALFLMYILPLLFLLIPLLTLPHFGVSELFTGLSALFAPILCYFFVWLFRRRIEKEVIFAAKKLNFT